MALISLFFEKNRMHLLRTYVLLSPSLKTKHLSIKKSILGSYTSSEVLKINQPNTMIKDRFVIEWFDTF
jgi:hypothetical protein